MSTKLRQDYPTGLMYLFRDARGRELYPYARVTWVNGEKHRSDMKLEFGHAIGYFQGKLIVQRDGSTRPIWLTEGKRVLIYEVYEVDSK